MPPMFFYIAFKKGFRWTHDKITKRKANYKSHNETVHQGLRRKTECDKCESRFVSHWDLKKHEKEDHTI